MSAETFQNFVAGATCTTFAVNLICVTYVLRWMRVESPAGTTRRIIVMLFRLAAYNLVPLGLFGGVFVLRTLGVVPPSSTEGGAATVISVLLVLAMVGLVLPGVSSVALLRDGGGR